MLRRFVVLLFPLLLGGCAEFIGLPELGELDWNPRNLNMSDCPSIDSYYLSPNLYGYDSILAFLENFYFYRTHEDYLKNKDNVVVYHVKTTSSGYYVEANDGIKTIEQSLQYDGKYFGCSNRYIVRRRVSSLHTYQEAGGGVSVEYGEIMLHANDQGDLVVSINNRQRKSRWVSLGLTSPQVISQGRPSFVFKKLNYKPAVFK